MAQGRPRVFHTEAADSAAPGGGAPLVSAATRRPLVSDRLVEEALRSGTIPAARTTTVARGARLVATCYFVALQRHPEYGRAAPESLAVALPLERLRAQTGLPRQAVADAVLALRAGGVLGTGADDAVSFAPRVLLASPVADGVHWDLVLERLSGKGPALLVVRHLAEALAAPGRWQVVPLKGVAAAVGYTVDAVRAAIEHACRAGVLRRATRPGAGDALRLSDAALDRAWCRPLPDDDALLRTGWTEVGAPPGAPPGALLDATTAGSAPVAAAVTAAVTDPEVAASMAPDRVLSAPGPVAAPASEPAGAAGLQLELNGVRVILPAGRAPLDLGALSGDATVALDVVDGRLTLRVTQTN